ncbi:MAG TPA: phosphodiester glycosidase family protein, partial [Cyclobacteriaceae bacterium]|nr:phosphodiester glycosidase family protein [Cyclobacteriaceae bacterium]
MKKLFLPFLLLIATASAAQSDSLTVVSAKWETKKIVKGVSWKSYLFKGNLFGSNQSINILEVRRNSKVTFAFGYDAKELKLTSDFGKGAAALAALNGTFFDIKNGGSVDYLKVNGQLIHKNRLQKDSTRAVHQKAAILLDGKQLKIEKWNGDPAWENALTSKDIMLSGPLLILNRQLESVDSSAFTYTRHPRTAIVVTNTDRVLLITVDGRDPNAAGMSLIELRKILKWLDAKDAINLDGGGSTTLWISNQPDNGVVN